MFWALKPSFWRKPAENARFHSNSCSQTMFSAETESKLGFENDPKAGGEMNSSHIVRYISLKKIKLFLVPKQFTEQ